MRILRWAIPLAVLVLIGAAGSAVFIKVREWTSNTPTTASTGPHEAPFALKTGQLDVSTVTSPQEGFSRSDPLRFWDIDLGTTVSEIRVRAVFRYHVPLDPRGWHVKRVGDQYRVIVPAVRPTLPVAIDTATLEKKTESGWLRFNKAENLEALEREMTKQLEKRASEPRYIELQRPKAREAAAEFVANWMITKEKWKVERSQVRVFFADEPIDSLDPMVTNF